MQCQLGLRPANSFAESATTAKAVITITASQQVLCTVIECFSTCEGESERIRQSRRNVESEAHGERILDLLARHATRENGTHVICSHRVLASHFAQHPERRAQRLLDWRGFE